MLDTKLYKNNANDMKNYFDTVIWCNNNNATIIDQGEYYEVVAIPAPDLADVKAAKRAEINTIRDQKEMEPINNFDVDEKSAIRILFVQNQLLRSGGTIDWTMADNTEENVDSADMNAIIDAIVEQSNRVHNIANYLKEQIEAATTAEEVNAIEWIDEIPEPPIE